MQGAGGIFAGYNLIEKWERQTRGTSRIFASLCYVGGCRRQIRWCTNNVSVISSCSVFFFSSLRGPSGSPPGALPGGPSGTLPRAFCLPAASLSALSLFFFFKTSLRVKCTLMCFQWYQLSIVRTIERDTTIPLGNPPDSPKANVCSKNI